MTAVLDGIRVLDLSSGPAGGIATMVLTDFGADVLKLERPGGDPWRTTAAAPMWLRGKRSIELDLTKDADQAELHALAAESDVVISTARPGHAAALGADWETLSALNDGLIYCSITGFGPRGPLAGYRGYEGVVAARAGRMLSFEGQAQREGPVFSAVRVGQHVASQSAVHGVLSALIVRAQTGRGQLVETSLLQGMMPYDMRSLIVQQLMRRYPSRFPVDPQAELGRMPTLQYHPVLTADGQWMQLGNLVEHLYHSFIQAADLSDIYVDPRYQGPPNQYDEAAREELRDRILRRMRERTADDWMQHFIEHGNVAAEPYRSTQQAMDHPQIRHNGNVIEIDTQRHGRMRQLGPVGKLLRTPASPSSAIPDPGEHNGAGWQPRSGPTSPNGAARTPRRPLDGITIVEFATIIATPYACSILGDLGARVLKVETLGGDQMRGMLEGAGAAKTTATKEGICINLKDERGQEIARRMIEGADAVIHNYRPGVPERLGIGYEQIREYNPEIVFVSATGYGSDGPYSHRPNAHPIPGAALGGAFMQAGGLQNMPVTDDIDELRETARQLMRANEVNPDPNTSMVIVSATLLALYAKKTQGFGQHVQVNMMGANAYANSDDFVQYEGKPERRMPDADLHGLGALYRLYGAAEGSWVFLACPTDGEWELLTGSPGFEQLGGDSRFSTAAARMENDADLASALGAVFTSRHADDWEGLLTARDVACVRADGANVGEFFDGDEQARVNGFIAEAEHLRWGPYWRHGPLVQFSDTPARAGAGILAGQHTRPLLREFGYDEDSIEALFNGGVVASEQV